jgi:hypothetical protein
MNASGAKITDKIGELWAELQKSEERLRTVGGGIAAPTMDCFVNDLPKDPFDATVFTALSDADVKARIGAAQPAVEAMVAAVVADIDGTPGAQLSPLFARGGAQLTPMAVVEGPHSQWTSGATPKPAPSETAAKATPREQLAQTAIEAKRKTSARQSATDALSAGFDTPEAHVSHGAPAKAARGKMMSSSDALHSSVAPAPEPMRTEPQIGPDMFDAKVPEPRAHRDLPTSVRAAEDAKIKPIKPKRSLWVRILWG